MGLHDRPLHPQPHYQDVIQTLDVLRDKVSAQQNLGYVLTLLFLKYLSDVQQDEEAEAPSRFILPPECNLLALYQQRLQPDLGQRLNRACQRLAEANPEKFAQLFRYIDFDSDALLGPREQRNPSLQRLLEILVESRLDLRPSQEDKWQTNGDTFEAVLLRFVMKEGKEAATFYTPVEIGMLMARLLSPQPGEQIADPACGSGSLLLQMAQAVPKGEYQLYGQELDPLLWSLCRMNMMMHGYDEGRIELGDTILQPKLVTGDTLMQFDLVVSVLPLTVPQWEAKKLQADPFQRFQRGVPQRGRPDFAFISHMLATAKEQTGRVGVVVPHGVLFRGGVEQEIRQSLVQENLLDAVIGLPAQLLPGTPIPLVLLLFRKDRQHTDVLFIDVREAYEERVRGTRMRHQLRVDLLDEIAAEYHRYETESPYVQRVSRQELAAHAYDLTITRYVKPSLEFKPTNPLALEKKMQELEKALRQIRREMQKIVDSL